MAKLSETSVPIMEGKVVLYFWPNSPYYQCRFRIGRKWIRTSTKTANPKEAKAFAQENYVEALVKAKNNIPIITRRFSSVTCNES